MRTKPNFREKGDHESCMNLASGGGTMNFGKVAILAEALHKKTRIMAPRLDHEFTMSFHEFFFVRFQS